MICPRDESITASNRRRLILASASPRRQQLLSQLGIVANRIIPVNVDETPHDGELPHLYAQRMAREKAGALEIAPDEIILAADTVVAVGRRILGKPRDRDEAERFLRLLSGRRHRVVTSVAVRRDDRLWLRSPVSTVRMKSLSDTELCAYLAQGEWQGKAGGYAIQGLAAAFIPWISGSYSAIMGLPLAETTILLQAAGFMTPGRE